MTQVRIQKLWRGHMTRWTQIMELTTSYDAVPLDITTLCCCVETTLFPLDITTLLWCDSVLKTRKKVRRKREEELIFIGMVSKTSVELISTQWQWQMTKMNISQMLSDFSLKLNTLSKTSVELISTQWQWQMAKMNINQMLSDFWNSTKLNSA